MTPLVRTKERINEVCKALEQRDTPKIQLDQMGYRDIIQR